MGARLYGDKKLHTQENVRFDEFFSDEVKALNCAQPENQVEPENAYVAMNGDEFTIVPESGEDKLKVKEAYKALDAAISGSQTSIDLGSTPDVYAVAAVTSEDSTLQATRDAYNNYTKASITYTFGDQTVTLDGSTLKNWLQFDEKGQLVQDDASFTQHVKDFSGTAGKRAQYGRNYPFFQYHKRQNRFCIWFCIRLED